MTKLEEMLCLLDAMSQDDLLELLHALGHNKKKSDDALVLQMAIDNRAASPASTAHHVAIEHICFPVGEIIYEREMIGLPLAHQEVSQPQEFK